MVARSRIIWLAFQSTPLCEGRHYQARRTDWRQASFNPRPCVRGDSGVSTAEMDKALVSIHAPV